MPRVISVMVFIGLFFCYSFAQDDSSQQNSKPKNQFSLAGSFDSVNRYGYGRIGSQNITYQTTSTFFGAYAGYDYFFNPYISAGVSCYGWFNTIASLLTVEVSPSFHPFPVWFIDPYIEIGGSVTRFLNYSPASFTADQAAATIIDLPATLGANIWFNKNFGLKVQGKLCLLSLDVNLYHLNGGIVFAF
jgi:hypothetical protein